MQSKLGALVLLGALATTAMTPVGPSAAGDRPVRTVDLRPGQLDRGADVEGPHLRGARMIIDGTTSVRVDEGVLSLLGASGKDYVAVIGSGQGEDARVALVRADGSVSTIARGFPSSLTLSDDGESIAFPRGATAKRTKILVKSTGGGPVVAKRAFAGSVSVLDLEDSRVVLGSSGPDRTLIWDLAWDEVDVVARKTGYRANAGADVFAYFTGDPYLRGCSTVATLSNPGRRVMKSCQERVEAFSPNGKRVATVGLLADGLGPTKVRMRRTEGSPFAAFTADYFGSIRWESDSALLLETFADSSTTIVRCERANCEAAAPVRRAPAPRVTSRLGLPSPR